MAATRSKSLATQVAAAGGVDAWNAKSSEIMGLDKIMDASCQATTIDEALGEVRSIMSLGHDLWAYAYMRRLYNKNESLYYGALLKDPITLLPVVYTPTVGEACQKLGKMPTYRRGCYVSINERGNLRAILEEYAAAELEKGPDGKPICECIVFSDGGRILGLGDLGAWGMGIPIGKLDLYTVCAGLNPHRTIPLIIDAGCGDAESNTAKLTIRDHALYTGLKQDRVVQRSKAGTIINKSYHEENGFIEEFMTSATDVFGKDVLLQFEDFNSNDAFPLLEAMRNKYVTYNDDIQGTASIAVAGLMGAMKLKRPSLTDVRQELTKEVFLFHGAGSANIGVMRLLTECGVSKAQIFVTNSRGVVWKNEDGSEGSFRNDEQKEFAQVGKPTFDPKDLVQAIRATKCTCLIGAVGRDPNCFTKPIVEAMVEISRPQRPVIFALSNPKTQAEITSEDCYEWSGGTAIYGSGTKMPSCMVNGEERSPAQVNNVYIFPGVSMGVVRCQAKSVPESFFLAAAEAVANTLNVDDQKADRVLPNLNRIRQVGLKVAVAVVVQAQKEGLAKRTLGEDPAEVERILLQEMWVPSGSEEAAAAAMQVAPPPAAAAAGGGSGPKNSGRQLPVDSDLNEHLAESSTLRAFKVSIDKKRPRYVEAGTVAATSSLQKDFEVIAADLKGSEPLAVLVRLKDADGTMPVKDTDWVVINYIPDSLKQKEKLQWIGTGDSFINNFPEKRMVEWRITSEKDVSYFAFCEVAKTVFA